MIAAIPALQYPSGNDMTGLIPVAILASVFVVLMVKLYIRPLAEARAKKKRGAKQVIRLSGQLTARQDSADLPAKDFVPESTDLSFDPLEESAKR